MMSAWLYSNFGPAYAVAYGYALIALFAVIFKIWGVK